MLFHTKSFGKEDCLKNSDMTSLERRVEEIGWNKQMKILFLSEMAMRNFLWGI